MSAAALAFSKAPMIHRAFTEGTAIRSAKGFWLAIPTPAAGRGAKGKHMTPFLWEQMTGIPLRFVYRAGRPSLLVADEARLNKRGRAAKAGTRTAKATVPIFILVPQVRMRKLLDVDRAGASAIDALPARIIAAWGTP